jgi:uncharacterized membrane protein YbaN (DUF454 family)
MPDPASVPLQQRLFLALGCVCFGLGVIGAVVPLLPTTPFLLLAAACWARSSRRFHDWLLRHRVFGPTLRTWEQHRALPPRVKFRAIVLLVLVLGTSAWLFVPGTVARAGVAACGLALVVFLARLPVRSP